MRTFLIFAYVLLSTATFASESYSVPQSAATWLYQTMDKSGKFAEGQATSPDPAYKGFIHCNQSYSVPGDHASGSAYCVLITSKANYNGINIPKRFVRWLSETMYKDGTFEEGADGIPGTSYTGILNCATAATEPDDHASDVPYCTLSATESKQITSEPDSKVYPRNSRG